MALKQLHPVSYSHCMFPLSKDFLYLLWTTPLLAYTNDGFRRK
jgi:hypothetical protein